MEKRKGSHTRRIPVALPVLKFCDSKGTSHFTCPESLRFAEEGALLLKILKTVVNLQGGLARLCSWVTAMCL